MKRVVIYWKTKDRERKNEVKTELGITSVSVNGESEYRGDAERLVQYVEEGIMTIRIKEYEEVRRKKVYINPVEGKSFNSKTVGCGRRKRKV